ncbi:MAG: uracil-DNA glycosylase, partial [Methylovulum sp.]|nr:uracil-DNA glycosylase [Methylovulum sp.]
AAELHTLPVDAVILALGTIAHQAVLKTYKLKPGQAVFGHHAQHRLPDGRILVDSYHTSRYNMQTKRLTQAMLHDVFVTISRLLLTGQ